MEFLSHARDNADDDRDLNALSASAGETGDGTPPHPPQAEQTPGASPGASPSVPLDTRSEESPTPSAPRTPGTPSTPPSVGDPAAAPNVLPFPLAGHWPPQDPATRPHVELEPGWVAASGLEHNNTDELLALMLRPSFRPARELDLVPVMPCPQCQDGGLRSAGTVRTRRGRQLVSACDTCGAVVLSLWLRWQGDFQPHDV